MTRMGLVSMIVATVGCQSTEEALPVESAPQALVARTVPFEVVVDDAGRSACGASLANATASLSMTRWWGGRVAHRIEVRDAVPHMLYTVWLKLDSSSPITGLGATPLAPADGLDELLEAGHGKHGHPAPRSNGFWTDSEGNGQVTGLLDFDPSGDSYPFDESDSAWGAVAIGHDPFTVRVISHCTDLLGHGAYPGPHEPTFDLQLN